MNIIAIKQYLDNQIVKAVERFDFESREVKYSELIKGWQINKFKGGEEIVRSYILAKLTNELGYKLENIEIEKKYTSGRKGQGKEPRIDIIVKDDKGNPFLFIELKSPDDYEKDKDVTIEEQLFNLASQEQGQGTTVKYLVLYTIEIINDQIKDKCIVIDYPQFKSFEDWKQTRDFTDEIPARYEKAQKIPYTKSSQKDLDSNFSHNQLDSLRTNLHNVLWGGGGTDDNDIFSSLVNIILAKIQDENDVKGGENYKFQTFAFQKSDDDEVFETTDVLFERINLLYRKALKERLNIEETKIKKSYIVDENKFSLNKLKYVVTELERFSFTEGKNSVDGKDLLGDFFEGIVSNGFKQSKGQFFTHINVVKFLLWGLQLDKLAINSINQKQQLPYIIDPSAGSGTFLIEYMKFLTTSVKRRFRGYIESSKNIENKIDKWFYPDNLENRWAEEFIYGSDINFNLGTATKVNMILHGDGSANIYVKDGLLPFGEYNNELATSKIDKGYFDKAVNEKFDVIVTNPPFSVDLDNDTKKSVTKDFIFGGKKNSENLFIERYYQLLKPNGRMGLVLPESVFDTTENKYIRLFIYKYFKVKAVVSLPQVTFEPFTSTKTSLLFAQKKTPEEIKIWNELWTKYSDKWNNLKTRASNLIDVYINNKDRSKLPSIKSINEQEELEILNQLLKNYLDEDDKIISSKDLVSKYQDELKDLCSYDKDTTEAFGFVNTWWVFGEVAKELNYKIFMAEVENVGYKRTKRGEKSKLNELYRTDSDGIVLVNDNIETTALDYLRKVKWD